MLLSKYRERKGDHSSLSFAEWLRSVDETKTPPADYKVGKRVLLGLKMCSVYNPVYFFQYLLLYMPHRDLSEILPLSIDGVPTQITYFLRARQLLPNVFVNTASFQNFLEEEGHKHHYITSVLGYINALNDLSILHLRHVLPTIPLQSEHEVSIHDTLQGQQLAAFALFKSMLEEREATLFHQHVHALQWKKFLLLTGKP